MTYIYFFVSICFLTIVPHLEATPHQDQNRQSIMRNFSKLKPKDLDKVDPETLDRIADALMLVSNHRGYKSRHFNKLVKVLSSIKPQNLDHIMAAFQNLRSPRGNNFYNDQKLLDILKTFTPLQCEKLTQHFDHFLQTGTWTLEGCSEVICILGLQDNKQTVRIAKTLSRMSQVQEQTWSLLGFHQVVQKILKLPTEKREAVLDGFDTLSQGQRWDSYDCSHVFETLHKTPLETINELVAIFRKFPTDHHWSTDECAIIINLLSPQTALPDETTLQALATTAQAHQWGFFEFVYMAKRFKDYPLEHVNLLIRKLDTLLTLEGMDIDDGCFLLADKGNDIDRCEALLDGFITVYKSHYWKDWNDQHDSLIFRVVRAFKDIKTEDVLSTAKAFTHIAKKKPWVTNDFQSIVNALYKIDLKKREAVAKAFGITIEHQGKSYTAPFSYRLKFPHEFRLKHLNTCDTENLEAIAQTYADITKETLLSSYHDQCLIDILSKTNPAQLSELAQAVLLFLKIGGPNEKKLNQNIDSVLRLLEESDPDVLLASLQYYNQCLQDGVWDKDHIRTLVTTMGAGSFAGIDGFINIAQQGLGKENGWCFEDLFNFIHHVNKKPADKTRLFFQKLGSTFEGVTYSPHKFLEFFDLLLDAEPEKLEPILMILSNCKEYNIRKWSDFFYIASSLSKHNKQYIVSVVNFSSQYLEAIYNGQWEWKSIQNALDQPDKNNLNDIFKIMSDISQDQHVNDIGQAYILNALVLVAPEQLDNIAKAFLRLLPALPSLSRSVYSDGDYWRIIRTLTQIESRRLDHIITSIVNISPYKQFSIAGLCECMSYFDEKDSDLCDDTTEVLSNLFQGKTWSSGACDFITLALLKTPKDGLSKVLSSFSTIVHGLQWEGDHYDSVLDTIGGTNNKSYSHINRTLEYFKYFGQEDIYRPLIQAIQSADQDRIDDISKAFQAIAQGRTIETLYAANTIEVLFQVPPDQLTPLVSAFMTYFPRKSPCMYSEVIQALAHCPSENRQKIADVCSDIAAQHTWSTIPYTKMIKALSTVHPEYIDNLRSMGSIFKNILYYPDDYLSDICQILSWLRPHDAPCPIDDLAALPSTVQKVVLYAMILTPPEDYGICLGIFKALFEREGVESLKGCLYYNILTDHIKIYNAKKLDRGSKLIEYWESILNHENQDRAAFLVQFIQSNVDTLGLYVEHPLVQLAIRVGTVLNSDQDEKNPYVVFDKLKEKRSVPVDWEALTILKGEIDETCGKLVPKEVMAFTSQFKIDLSSVPSVNAQDFMDLMTDLTGALIANTKRYQGIQTMARNAGAKIEPLIAEARKPESLFCRLMNAPTEVMDGSRLKCVIKWFQNMPDSAEKWTQLSTFLCGVRYCGVGKSTAIQDWYLGLPTQLRIQSAAGPFDCDRKELPAWQALRDSIQTVVSRQFTPESVFMKKVCGTVTVMRDGEVIEEIPQAAHQIQFMKGLVGDKVGLGTEFKFDLNAQCISLKVLNTSLQDMLHMYYEHVDIEQFSSSLIGAFSTFLVREFTPSEAYDDEGNPKEKPIYRGLRSILPDHGFSQCFDYDEDYQIIGVTPLGMHHLLRKAGVFEEEEGVK